MDKRTLITVIATSIMGLGVATTASAEKPYKDSYHVRGEGGYAMAFSDDECSWGSFDISINNQVVHSNGGKPVTEAGGWVGYWSFNWCTGEEIAGGYYLAELSFDSAAKSASASAQFLVDVWAWKQTPDGHWDYVYVGTRKVKADVSWTAVGQPYRGMESWSSRWGQTFARYRWMGTSYQAEVSASVTMDGEELPFDHADGSFGNYHGGSTEMYR